MGARGLGLGNRRTVRPGCYRACRVPTCATSAAASADPLGCDAPTVTLRDRIPASLRGRQAQDMLLYVRGQLKEVHDLRHPCPGHVPEAGQVGLVGYGAGPDQVVVEADRQGHQPADAGRRPAFPLGETPPRERPYAPGVCVGHETAF